MRRPHHLRPARRPSRNHHTAAGCSHNTVRASRSVAARLELHGTGQIPVERLAAQHRDFATSTRLSAGSVRRTHAVIRAALNQTVRSQLAARNVTGPGETPVANQVEPTIPEPGKSSGRARRPRRSRPSPRSWSVLPPQPGERRELAASGGPTELGTGRIQIELSRLGPGVEKTPKSKPVVVPSGSTRPRSKRSPPNGSAKPPYALPWTSSCPLTGIYSPTGPHHRRRPPRRPHPPLGTHPQSRRHQRDDPSPRLCRYSRSREALIQNK